MNLNWHGKNIFRLEYNDWSKTNISQFLSVIDADYKFKYRLLPEAVTKNYIPEVLATRVIVLVPVFFQHSIDELGNCIFDLPEEIIVTLYERCLPIKDKVMQLALYLADKDSTKVSISMDNIESISHEGYPETKVFGSLGAFQGYSTIYDDTKYFCLPFGDQTLIIKE